jgi:hypothetical protein
MPKRGHFASVYDKPSWQEFINQRLVAYAKAARHYLDRPTSAKSAKEIAPLMEGAVREQNLVEFAKAERFAAKPGTLTKLVFYERLKLDPVQELTKIFQFMDDLYAAEGKKSVLPEGGPEQTARCAMAHYTAATQGDSFKWQRKHTRKFNPWTPAQVKQICSALGKWWFQDIWGTCLEGKLQWQREEEQQLAGGNAADTAATGGGEEEE